MQKWLHKLLKSEKKKESQRINHGAMHYCSDDNWRNSQDVYQVRKELPELSVDHRKWKKETFDQESYEVSQEDYELN